MTAQAETPKIEMIAKFSTYYGYSSENRKFNIELACKKIDKTALLPEDEFSFNDIVGKRTKQNGFRSAFIISDGKFVEGTGGGICQVSSTIYNCALLADLAVTHVRAHSLPVSYVLPSFDAMVSSTNDFRFVNSSPLIVSITCIADGDYIHVKMYGLKQNDIRRKSVTVQTLPFGTKIVSNDTLEPETETIVTTGKNGLKSIGYLEYYKNGKLTKTKEIRRDHYCPQTQIVEKNLAVVKDSEPST